MRAKQTRRTSHPSAGEQYRRQALLWSVSGYWPISRVARGDRRGYDGCPKEPPPLPEVLSELELGRIRALLERRNWTLVTGPDGRLVPIRML